MKTKRKICIGLSIVAVTGLVIFLIWFNFFNYKFSINEDGYLEYSGTAAYIIVPSEIDGKKVKLYVDSFGENQFLRVVKIEEGIEEINGFEVCSNLRKVVLPESARALQDYAFFNCDKLSSINLDHIEYLGSGSVSTKSLTLDYFPQGYKSDIIKACAFQRCKIKEIVVPDCVTKIEHIGFADVNTSKVVIPETVTSIGKRLDFIWTNGENYYVKEGSYAESWMKENGHTYHLYS